MTTKIFTDRSRIIEMQRCPRRRWLTYHEAGGGITTSRTPIALGVGGAVHAGLAVLLREGQEQWDADQVQAGYWSSSTIEEHAVKAALTEFTQRSTHLELDATEQAAMQPTPAAIWQTGQLKAQAAELGMPTEGLGLDREQSRGEFERYLFAEQSALVEGLVRAYARRRLRPLLEQFEVLEVEREGSWKLSEWVRWSDTQTELATDQPTHELWFMSRPDALLRERQSNELYLLSYKTTGGWDVRKARDIQHDMQGLSEGVEVERRLGEWWQALHGPATLREEKGLLWKDLDMRMEDFLRALPAPPRMHAIRYEFLLKGERWEDREMTARLGMTVRTQRSHLIRQYVATSTPKKGEGGYRVGDVCWSWEFYRPEDNKDSKLAWQNWKSREVFHSNVDGTVPIKAWIDALDDSQLLMSGEDSTVGLEPRPLGYKSRAQAMGVTAQHPLDAVFVPPVVVYRNMDSLRDWVESVEHQEREVAQHVAEVNAAADSGEKRHLLNLYFPQHLHSCEYPSQCPFARDRVGVCFAGAEMQTDPLTQGAGEYTRRVPNHPIEASGTQLVDIKK